MNFSNKNRTNITDITVWIEGNNMKMNWKYFWNTHIDDFTTRECGESRYIRQWRSELMLIYSSKISRRRFVSVRCEDNENKIHRSRRRREEAKGQPGRNKASSYPETWIKSCHLYKKREICGDLFIQIMNQNKDRHCMYICIAYYTYTLHAKTTLSTRKYDYCKLLPYLILFIIKIRAQSDSIWFLNISSLQHLHYN